MSMEFEARIRDGLNIVRRVLDQNRNPSVAADVEHAYDDKFLLAEFLTAGACGALTNSLEQLGLNSTILNETYNTSKDKKSRVTLRFSLSQECKFIKEQITEIENPTSNVTEVSGARNFSVKSKTITKLKEFLWNYNMNYTISIYMGTQVESATVILSSEKTAELKTRSSSSPHPSTSISDPIDADITWLIQQLNEEQQLCFGIDRSDTKCHTPRRNKDINAAVDFYSTVLAPWCRSSDRLIHEVWNTNIPILSNPTNCDLTMINSNRELVIPILPLLERKHDNLITEENDKTNSSTVLPRSDLQAMLSEQSRALTEKVGTLLKVYPKNSFPNSQDGTTRLVFLHIVDICNTYEIAVNYIERMIYDQLVRALGKVVTADDFGEYMLYHNRKVFKTLYAPRALSYSVRSGECAPEGFFSIERVSNCAGEIDEAITTTVRKLETDANMKFDLNAASQITFSGNRYIHSFINHRFSTQQNHHNLVASTRQFCSYIVLLGRIGGNDLFLPTGAFVLKNKDEMTIPLILEEVPSPKQFKSAIESLSPEQQRFAKSYRSMQLESTLFGMCVIQVKPQLERVLNLNPGALQKEIALTQDLTEIFIDYQIASDLLSFQCDMFTDPDDVPGSEKISAVKKRVGEIKAMLKAAKEEEIENKKLEAKAANPFHSSSSSSCSGDSSNSYSDDEDCYEGEKLEEAFCDEDDAGNELDMLCSAVEDASFICDDKQLCPTEAPKEAPKEQPKPTQAAQQKVSAPIQQNAMDISQIPSILEKRFEAEDTDDALRPTIIKTGDCWLLSSREGLLKEPELVAVFEEDQKELKNRAFDLLDAITRSGALDITDVDLHVIVATTHCFDKSLMDTVVQDNTNPIEKLQKSTLIAATTIHGKPEEVLLK